MNLIIDVGNTKVKLAVFGKDRILRKKSVLVNELIDEVSSLISGFPSLNKGIISSVANLEQRQIKNLLTKIDLMVLKHNVKLPFKNTYKTPQTLGVDRLALVSAAVKLYPKKNTLIIDAGTCITYDFINAENTYLGGAISPGLRTRYKSLNNLTANLPLLESKMPRKLTGNSTDSSIHSGIVNGIAKEIDGIIDEYRQTYQHLTVILTGGDANFLSKRLKNSIFANSNFLLEGLNYILEFNTDQ